MSASADGSDAPRPEPRMWGGPVRGTAPGVAAIDYEGGRYCITCAANVIDGDTIAVQTADDEWETIEDADGEEIVDRLIYSDIYTFGSGGVVLKYGVNNGETWHCGRYRHCEHAHPPEEHPYDHDNPVGVKLKV